MELAFDYDLTEFENGCAQFVAQTNPRSEPMQVALFDAATVYMAGTITRYGEQSQGGGVWPDLAESTKIARWYKLGNRVGRKGAKKGVNRAAAIVAGMHFDILIDTAALYASFMITGDGHIEFALPDGHGSGSAVFYALYHQEGTPRMPARVILVDPSDPTMPTDATQKIREEFESGYAAMARAIGFETA